MLEEKKKILDKNVFLNIRKQHRIISEKEKNKRRYLILSVFLSLVIICGIYFLSKQSNIYRVVVSGNNYLNEEDILRLSNVTTDNKFLTTLPFVVEKNVKTNPLVEDCKVELLDGRLVKINVQEKKIIGYTYENNKSVLVTDKDERIELDRDNLYIINKVPLIEGFNQEDLVLIEKELVNCDYSIINEISEIHYYPELKYQYVEVIMRDGNYVFTSPYGLKLLNKYYDMESSYARDKHNCYYFEDISGNAYTSACPWQSEQESQEINSEEETQDSSQDYEYYEDEDYQEEE